MCDDEGVNLLHNNFEYPWNLRPLFIIDTKFDKQNSIITINSEKKWEGFDDHNYKIEMVYGETGFELFVEMEGIFLEDLIPDLFADERKIQLRDIYEFLEVSGKDFIRNVSGKDPSVVEKLLETKFDLDCTFYALITHMIPEVKYYPNLL